jgi:hypothetical protein
MIKIAAEGERGDESGSEKGMCHRRRRLTGSCVSNNHRTSVELDAIRESRIALVFEREKGVSQHILTNETGGRQGRFFGFALLHRGLACNGAAGHVESQGRRQLFEADTTLESPAVCSAI